MDNHDDHFPADTVFDDEIEFRRLIRSLELAEKYFLHFACCTAPRQRELIAQAQQSLPDYNLKIVSFKERIVNLLQELAPLIAEEKPGAIFVNGLEYSISQEGQGKENALITNLNLARDAFPQKLSCPLVLWLPEYALVKIINNAPDFFSVRSGVFYFSATPERVREQIARHSTAQSWETSSLSLEAKQQKRQTLQSLLEEYKALPLDKRDQAARLRLLDKIVEIHYTMADYPPAIAYAEQALAIAQEIGDKKSGADSYNNLAALYRAQGRYDEAEPLYKKALAIREQALGADHPDTATSYNNLAVLYESQGRYDEAEPLYKKALAIREQALGETHPDTATSYNNLAVLYEFQSRYDEAEPLYKKALAIREQALGETHPDTAASYNNLAALYHAQGRYDEAEPLYKKALAIREQALGETHPYTAASYNNLGVFYADQGKWTAAQEYLTKALAIWQAKLGEKHPHTVNTKQNLEYVRQGH